jgi:hypothetical protein
MKTHGERLREALAGAERGGLGKSFPRELQRRAGAYAQRRLGDGCSLHAVARELGVSRSSLYRWMGPPEANGFAPVVFEAAPLVHALPDASLSVTHVGCGLRIEGLTLDDVVALIERLK